MGIPRAPRSLQCLLVLCAQETPDPWQSLDPFDSLDSKPFKKGNWVEGHLPWASVDGLSGAPVVGEGGLYTC